jgi:hypothetical protein
VNEKEIIDNNTIYNLNDRDNQITENDKNQKFEIMDPYSLIVFNINLKEIFDENWNLKINCNVIDDASDVLDQIEHNDKVSDQSVRDLTMKFYKMIPHSFGLL